MPNNIFNQHLEPGSANRAVLSPLSFIRRTAQVYPEHLAIIYGDLRRSWGETYRRCCQLASSLQRLGIGKNDTVAVLLPNTPPMVEVHFAVPMAGAVLNTLNTRLDAASIALMLDHGEAKALIVDVEFAATAAKALKLRQSTAPLVLISAEDALYGTAQVKLDAEDYEHLVASGDANFNWQLPNDEWDAITLNYTSGTTGSPKGVVYHHRGAALAALSSILDWDMPMYPVYLWTLPMFHCNGWCFPWVVAARAGINVCLRRVDAKSMFAAMHAHGVTHYCSAPIVHGLLINAEDSVKPPLPSTIRALVAGAAPSAAMIEGLEKLGIDLTHVYGLTETYGPAAVCAKQGAWSELSISERARLNARQGVRYLLEREVCVLNPQTMQPVPWDGQTMGEIMFRGDIVMKGYLKNPEATQEAFRGGWFHSGDLAVQYPDGYIQIKDRSKDIIISGGENISSLEVEDVLYRHPAVMVAAVVAKNDPKWGETPCAFIECKAGLKVSTDDIIRHCREHLPHYKVPRHVVFTEIPKTSTGKLQKFELRKRLSQES